jgi:threonylcarbamoyladenosine tRNA methylthiotransferase MtaB
VLILYDSHGTDRAGIRTLQALSLRLGRLPERGVKEVVLTGVNIGDFGKSTGESFAALLSELVKVQGIERYRISSIEPNLLTDEIIRMATVNEKILPHFHIPLQSGSDKVLGLMRRRYTREVLGQSRTIRKLIPFAGIGADIVWASPANLY